MIDVIFEDNQILVLNKPAGILTEPSGTDQVNLLDLAKDYLKEKYQKPGNVFLGIVHRLDKQVSGIVLFAKTSKALSRLNEAMREKKYKKVYLALVEGIPSNDEMTLEHYLIHDDFKATISTKENHLSKYSKLHYKILEKMKSKALLEVILETGRYHQIRVQLSTIGHPIVGDFKYGSKIQNLPSDVIALHHTKLEMIHPVTKALLFFESNPPKYFS